MNNFITSEINNWDIEYDPYHFFNNTDWFKNITENGKVLEILHTYNYHKIEVHYFNNQFQITLLKDNVNIEKSMTGVNINEIIKSLIVKYVN